MFDEANLILNSNGSIYHLSIFPEELADTIITVGDPDRASEVSKYFDKIELKRQHREFVTHTGELSGKRMTVLSTGIGTDNVDICLNELDALANIDFKTRHIKSTLKSLNIIRIGTSGALQKDIPVDSNVISQYALGFDNLLKFYQYKNFEDETAIMKVFIDYSGKDIEKLNPYFIKCSPKLFQLLNTGFYPGITVTCPGFYAPQGRQLRGKLALPAFRDKLESFHFKDLVFSNFEMETSGIFGLGRVLNHHCCSLNAIIVNRIRGEKSKDIPKLVDNLIVKTLEKLIENRDEKI